MRLSTDRVYDLDLIWTQLQESEWSSGNCLGCFPRPLASPGLRRFKSFNDTPDKLVAPLDYKEVIKTCRDEQIFPEFHQARTWAPPNFQWNQNGLPYCWAWAITGALMDVRAREGKENVMLAPISLGGAVDWKNRGNYLEHAINWVIKRGIASVEYCPVDYWWSRNPDMFHEGWEDNALKYRFHSRRVWKMDRSSAAKMIQHCITALRQADPIYIAYYWWGHALELIGLRWNEDVPNNLEWVIRNSHNENKPIVVTGNRAVPDEGWSIMASA